MDSFEARFNELTIAFCKIVSAPFFAPFVTMSFVVCAIVLVNGLFNAFLIKLEISPEPASGHSVNIIPDPLPD